MKFLMLTSLVVFSLGCSHGNCRHEKTQPPAAGGVPVTEANVGSSKKAVSVADRVKVYKADGSLQCGQGKGVAAAEMQKELKNIPVHSANNRNDGMMRIQVCGSPTGQVNVYEINRTDLEKALKLGFKEWTQD